MRLLLQLLSLTIAVSLNGQSINFHGTFSTHVQNLNDIDGSGGWQSQIEQTHAQPVLSSISSPPCINCFDYSMNKWPNGSWLQGYFNSYIGYNNYDSWYTMKLSNHPLIRQSTHYIIGYIHAYRSLPNSAHNPVFKDRALQGLDYLISEQNSSDGSFPIWFERASKTSPDDLNTLPNSFNTNKKHITFTMGEALKALSEGYWFRKCELGEPYSSYSATQLALFKAANWFTGSDYNLDCILPNGKCANGNSNVRGLCLSGLASAYKSLGNQDYLDACDIIGTQLIQDQNSYGSWNTGVLEDFKYPESGTAFPSLFVSGDFDYDGKDEVIQQYQNPGIYIMNDDLKMAYNNLYPALPGQIQGLLEKVISGNFDSDASIEVLQKFDGNNSIYLYNNGQNFATNSIYSAGATLDKWVSGDFDGDGRDEVLQKYTNSNTIYLWDDGYLFGTNSIYTAGATIDKWLVGDFDGDGKDEVLQKYTNSNTIYLWDDGYLFGANSIYTAGATIDKWLVGDFDGDGRDEVLQKYTNSNTIYLWNYGLPFGANSIYTGSYSTGKWISSDVDGDGKDEVIHQLIAENGIYIWDLASKPWGSYKLLNIDTKVYHDNALTYHLFIMDGLIEYYSISSGSRKNDVGNVLKLAINNLIERLHPTNTNEMTKYLTDQNGNYLPEILRFLNSSVSSEAIQILSKFAFWAKNDPNFSASDLSNLASLANRLAVRQSQDLVGYAVYKDFIEAYNSINPNEYIDYYGGCAQYVFRLKNPKTGTEVFENQSAINVFPNPNTGQFQVRTTSGTTSVQIYSYSGDLLNEISIENEKELIIIDMTLPNGMYFIKSFDGKIINGIEKFVVSK